MQKECMFVCIRCVIYILSKCNLPQQKKKKKKINTAKASTIYCQENFDHFRD